MMKTFKNDIAAASSRRVVAAAMLAAGVLGGMAGAANAQAGSEPSGVAPAKLQVFSTEPAVRQATLDALAAAQPGPNKAGGAPALAVDTLSASAKDDASAPWVLDATTRPWALAYSGLNPLNGIFITLPPERDARMMLPGQTADIIDRARFTITRYVTDNIGSASQSRGRQLEALNLWIEGAARQKASLSKDPWQAYQFNKEALASVREYKEKVAAQSGPTVQRMASDINDIVAKITPIMEAMGSYEQKLQWYNLLVQLKEGVGLYQARTAELDHQIIEAIEAFERANPSVMRPDGPLPPQPSDVPSRPTMTEPATPAAVNMSAAREPAQAPEAAKQSSSTGGLVVLLGVVVLIVFFFLRLRKRVAKKGALTKDITE